MRALEEQKRDLNQAIQTENAKTALFENEASISSFYKRFAQATINTPETREQLFEYFVDKIYITRNQIIIVSYYYNDTQPIEYEDLEEALTTGSKIGELRTYARKREFDSSPSGGDGGNSHHFTLIVRLFLSISTLNACYIDVSSVFSDSRFAHVVPLNYKH